MTATPRFRLLEKLPRLTPSIRRLRALEPELDRLVELRILSNAASQAQEDDFWTEQRALATLDHPAFPPVLMTGSAAGRPCYAVPLREAPTLGEALQSGELTGPDRLAYLRGLAGALAAAHQRGLGVGGLRADMLRLDPVTDAVRLDRVQPGASIAEDIRSWGRLAAALLAGDSSVPERVSYVIQACLQEDEDYRPGDGAELLKGLRRTPVLTDSIPRVTNSDIVGGPTRAGVCPPTPPPLPKLPPEPRRQPVHTLGLIALGLVLGAGLAGPGAAGREAPGGITLPRVAAPVAPVVRTSRPALAPSRQARYLGNRRVRQLAAVRKVTPEEFREHWRTLRILSVKKDLPRALGDWNRLKEIKHAYSADAAEGCAAFERYLEELRTLLDVT
jgi:hypothetical protein